MRRLVFVVLLSLGFLLLFAWEPFQLLILRTLFPLESEHIYPRETLFNLIVQHLILVGISSFLSSIIGISLGLVVTGKWGREFLPLVRDFASIVQTFPPIAVIALAVPAVGFGFKPAIIALLLYGILPVVNNTIAGIESVPVDSVEAARGMGMTPLQILWKIQLPLAARVIAAGVRTSVVINIGTATLGAVVGAGGLGVIIVSGLIRDNIAFVSSGALTAAVLAGLSEWIFSHIENLFYKPDTVAK